MFLTDKIDNLGNETNCRHHFCNFIHIYMMMPLTKDYFLEVVHHRTAQACSLGKGMV